MSLSRLEALGERISKFDKECVGLRLSITHNTPKIMKFVYKELIKSPLFKNNLICVQFDVNDIIDDDDSIDNVKLIFDNKDTNLLMYLRLLDNPFINNALKHTEVEEVVDYVIELDRTYPNMEQEFFNVFNITIANLMLLIDYLISVDYLLDGCFDSGKTLSYDGVINKFEILDQ